MLDNNKKCKHCGNSLKNVSNKDYIIPKNRKNRKLNNDLVNLYPDKSKYIKPTRLQIFNDEIEENDNNEFEEQENNVYENIEENEETNSEQKAFDNIEQNQALLSDANNENNPYINDLKVSTNKEIKNKKAFFKNIELILPKEIAGEIILGKLKSVFKSFLGIMLFLYGVISIIVYYFHNVPIIKHISDSLFISLPLSIISIIFGAFLFVYGAFQYSNFRAYTNKYKKDCKDHETYAQFPPFLREIYVKRIKWRYYIILITAISYTLALVLIPILYLIEKYKGSYFSVAWWTVGKTPDVHNIIFASWIIIGIMTVALLINILINEKRHSIISIYTSNNVLSSEEKKEIVKKTKKKCLIIYGIFLSFVLIFFLIPFLILLFKKGKTKIIK